jgi:hypothetical protein
LKEIAHGLMIPNYEAWFKTRFGEEDGAKMAAAYKKSPDWQENGLAKLFEGLAKDRGEWQVEDTVVDVIFSLSAAPATNPY